MSIPSSGSSTARSASTTSSLLIVTSVMATSYLEAIQAHFLAPFAAEEVDAVDKANPVAARAHHERVRPRAVGEEADAAEQVAVRHAGRGDDRLARREVVDGEETMDVVDPLLGRLLDLATRGRPELRLHLAAEAAQRSRGHDGLARPTDADGEVVVRAANRSRDRSGHVTVLDQLDARAGGANLLDQVVMPRPVENDRRHVVHLAPER